MADREPLDIDALMAEVDASLSEKPRAVPSGKGTSAKNVPARQEKATPVPAERGRIAAAVRLAVTTALVIGVLVYLGGMFIVGFLTAIPFALGAGIGAFPATMVGRLSRS